MTARIDADPREMTREDAARWVQAFLRAGSPDPDFAGRAVVWDHGDYAVDRETTTCTQVEMVTAKLRFDGWKRNHDKAEMKP